MNEESSAWVLVTGASGGIGEELARLFANDGKSLVLVARNARRLEELKAEFLTLGSPAVRVIPADLAAVDGAASLLSTLASEGLRVETLVNNAGYGLFGDFAQAGATELLDMLRLNVLALTELCRGLIPGMVSAGRGRVLNIASLAAFMPGPHMAAYYASKAFVLSLSEGLNEELRGTGVLVTALCPGPTRTGFEGRAGLGGSGLFQSGLVMGAGTVARIGYRALGRGRAVAVPGLFNKLAAFLPRLSPRTIQRRLVGRIQAPRS